ncbi:hypothetical protein PIB30_060131 [Stylosanthes scabra]|uniref:Uncharacterized protein n=1 Tax=Stylosanthes scabra TaxID=79078 RepID=A0ABU6YL04_9FABA|nr:hypothetical protein [Stylosanthes scabra]
MVKMKGAPRKFPNGQKSRRCLHCRSTKHNIRTCPNLSNKKDFVHREEESLHPEFEDDLTVEESETNDLVDTQESTPAKTTPMQSSINDKKHKGRTPKEFFVKTKSYTKDWINWQEKCAA